MLTVWMVGCLGSMHQGVLSETLFKTLLSFILMEPAKMTFWQRQGPHGMVTTYVAGTLEPKMEILI